MQSSAPTQTWKKKNATGFCQLLSVGGDITILKQVKLEQHEQPKLPITQTDRKKEEQKKKKAHVLKKNLFAAAFFFFPQSNLHFFFNRLFSAPQKQTTRSNLKKAAD